MTYEKKEKQDEKELEKREEKATTEKNWDEKWRRDPVNALVWAAIFIWSGLVFLGEALGLFDAIFVRARGDLDSWSFVFLGAGVIVLIGALARWLTPEYRRPVTGNVIIGLVLLGIGLGDLFNWAIVWAVILILIGLSIVLRGLGKRQST